MVSISLSCTALYTEKQLHSITPRNSHQSRAFYRVSPRLLQVQTQEHWRWSSLNFNPLRVLMSNKKRNGYGGAVCYSPLNPRDLQWISTVSNAVLMLAKGTAIHKSFLVPLFALQAPGSLVSWMKGEYGMWTAFLALLVRLFFFIPGELELPFIALLLVIVCPHQVTRLRLGYLSAYFSMIIYSGTDFFPKFIARDRGSKEGVIVSLAIAAYLAFQHFSRAGSLGKAFDQGSILATLATISVVAVPCLLLF